MTLISDQPRPRRLPPPSKADKAIAEMVREAAKLGVKGTEEWLKGLYELFGGGIGKAYLDTIAQANQSPLNQAARKFLKAPDPTLLHCLQLAQEVLPEVTMNLTLPL